jgi:hypothetical protein
MQSATVQNVIQHAAQTVEKERERERERKRKRERERERERDCPHLM